jgi:LAS superfamily LD-carboxypeptidase LdcB
MVGEQPRRHRGHTVVFGLLLAALSAILSPAGAQDDVEALDDLKAEREAIQEELAEQALRVDAATADFDVLAKALDDINALVDLQEARLLTAEQAIRSAEEQVAAAETREAEIAARVEVISAGLADLAVASFTGETGANGEDLTALLLSDDPSEAARRRSLVEFQTGSLSDGIDELRSLIAEAETVSNRRRAAVEAAEAGRADVLEREAEVDLARAAQLEIVLAAETRLEARLSEAAFIEERDEGKAAEIRAQEEAIARRIRAEAAAAAAAAAAEEAKNRPPAIPPAPPEDMRRVQGIEVHKDIADRVDQMLTAARNDGIDLGGWGYRSNLKQIELRQKHCGTSEYDVWEKPASACSPPTARPGQSNHERGLAIDFTYNGGSMTSRSNPGFVWLAENAATYGFVNLPSEPWHWSTDGN